MTRQLHWFWAYHICYRAQRQRDKILFWVAYHLPRDLTRCCYIRVASYATSGKYGDTVVPELGMMDALARWR